MMEEFAVKLGFVVILTTLIAISWRADMARWAVWRMARPIRRTVVPSSRTGRAATTLRIGRASNADEKEE
jgi:hypothetical protein